MNRHERRRQKRASVSVVEGTEIWNMVAVANVGIDSPELDRIESLRISIVANPGYGTTILIPISQLESILEELIETADTHNPADILAMRAKLPQIVMAGNIEQTTVAALAIAYGDGAIKKIRDTIAEHKRACLTLKLHFSGDECTCSVLVSAIYSNPWGTQQ